MTNPTKSLPVFLFTVLMLVVSAVAESPKAENIQTRTEDLLTIDNGTIKVGIDRSAGASITWLSGESYPKNIVNSHDPGRLIQQSYYAGHRLDRSEQGQSPAWSPWTWNPIQGGGVGSWARVTKFERLDDKRLYAETVPKLWDMPDEEAAALMRQWTAFEPGMPNVVAVRCELEARRPLKDPWGPAAIRPQELPACYFTRKFSRFMSYLGNGEWRTEWQRPGPPWGKAEPPRRAMACFNSQGLGVAVFSPGGTAQWNFGPHGEGNSSGASDGPCVHVAPIAMAALGPQSTMRYRYWLIVGTQVEIGKSLEILWGKYKAERLELENP
jgi:hypothetical protein